MGACMSTRDTKVMDVHFRAKEGDTKSSAKITDFYTMGDRIGKGGFGEVRIGTEKSSGVRYAIKALSKLKVYSESEREHMKMETTLMARVRGHLNVVQLHETYEDRGNFYLVMELCEGGELMERILEAKHFSERVAARYFRMMLLGVKHCHDNSVVHRDLKPENFIFASTDPAAEVKLTDFGLSTHIASPDSIITDACGSAYYIAPEVFSRAYTRAADVWSLGVLLFLLLSGTVPFGFDAEREEDVYKSIQSDELKLDGPVWASISSAAKELVVGLLEKNPRKRYTLEQALEHAWISADAANDAAIDRSVVLSMYNFNARNRFKKNALKLIASTLSASDVQSLRRMFHELDTDNTGTISFTELRSALKQLGFAETSNDQQVERLMQELDSDRDGSINYEEFLIATAERRLVHNQNNIWWAFCEYDADGDGRITLAELKQAMGNEPDEDVQRYIAEFDTDKDGTIDYEEFMRMVLPKDLKYRISKYS